MFRPSDIGHGGDSEGAPRLLWLAERRRLLRKSTTQDCGVLQRVLKGRLTFNPRADGTG